MRITGGKRQIMHQACSGDPQVVLRNHGAEFCQPCLYLAVALSNFLIVMHGLHQRKEGLDTGELLVTGFGVIGSDNLT